MIHTRGASVSAQPAGDGSVFVTYHLAKELPIDDRQVIELGLAMFCNEIRHHAEPDWEPASVQFCHRAPPDLSLHRRFFGPALSFDQDRNAVRIQAEVLARPVAAADERSRRMMSAVLAGRQSRTPEAALSRIEGAIRAMMPFSACTVGEVASAIATSPRTLQRQLAENGTTFQKLRDQVRADLALKYLRQSTLRLGRDLRDPRLRRAERVHPVVSPLARLHPARCAPAHRRGPAGHHPGMDADAHRRR